MNSTAQMVASERSPAKFCKTVIKITESVRRAGYVSDQRDQPTIRLHKNGRISSNDPIKMINDHQRLQPSHPSGIDAKQLGCCPEIGCVADSSNKFDLTQPSDDHTGFESTSGARATLTHKLTDNELSDYADVVCGDVPEYNLARTLDFVDAHSMQRGLGNTNPSLASNRGVDADDLVFATSVAISCLYELLAILFRPSRLYAALEWPLLNNTPNEFPAGSATVGSGWTSTVLIVRGFLTVSLLPLTIYQSLVHRWFFSRDGKQIWDKLDATLQRHVTSIVG